MIKIALREPAPFFTTDDKDGVRTVLVRALNAGAAPEGVAVAVIRKTAGGVELDEQDGASAVDVRPHEHDDRYAIDLSDGRPRLVLLVYDATKSNPGWGTLFSHRIEARSLSAGDLAKAVETTLRKGADRFRKSILYPS